MGVETLGRTHAEDTIAIRVDHLEEGHKLRQARLRVGYSVEGEGEGEGEG